MKKQVTFTADYRNFIRTCAPHLTDSINTIYEVIDHRRGEYRIAPVTPSGVNLNANKWVLRTDVQEI